ncbi:MAG: hypothetical protein ACRELF_28830, partial [Gemmataceae bacterium]
FTDHVLAIIDLNEPTRPEIVGRWWLPGMHAAGGETPGWPKGRRFALHHAIVAGNLAYGAWRAIMDLTAHSRSPILFHKEIGDAASDRTFPPLLP